MIHFGRGKAEPLKYGFQFVNGLSAHVFFYQKVAGISSFLLLKYVIYLQDKHNLNMHTYTGIYTMHFQQKKQLMQILIMGKGI